MDARDVTDEIRAERIGNLASAIAPFPALRSALLDRQRAFRKAPGLVADGRDMGTIVFPRRAFEKCFLVADVDARAERRYRQLIERGTPADLDLIRQDLHARDARDANRKVAPLMAAADAVDESTARRSGWIKSSPGCSTSRGHRASVADSRSGAATGGARGPGNATGFPRSRERRAAAFAGTTSCCVRGNDELLRSRERRAAAFAGTTLRCRSLPVRWRPVRHPGAGRGPSSSHDLPTSKLGPGLRRDDETRANDRFAGMTNKSNDRSHPRRSRIRGNDGAAGTRHQRFDPPPRRSRARGSPVSCEVPRPGDTARFPRAPDDRRDVAARASCCGVKQLIENGFPANLAVLPNSWIAPQAVSDPGSIPSTLNKVRGYRGFQTYMAITNLALSRG